MNFLLKDDKKESHFLISAFVAFCFIALLKSFWTDVIPFGLFEVWSMGTGSTWEGVKAFWPAYLWAAALTLIVSFITLNDPKVNRNAESILFGGTVVSVMAGLLEEIAFRWWIFYGAILGFKVANFLLCGLVGWFASVVALPLGNFLTLGYLAPYLFHPVWGVAVGSAILSANGDFRDGHLYLGFFGYINSWFMGMFLFYIMFNYGLLAGILAHFIYDEIIFVIRYIDAEIERQRGLV